MEIVGFTFKSYPKEDADNLNGVAWGVHGTFYPCYFSTIFSPECFCVDYGYGKLDNYVYTSAPVDCVTVTYRKKNPDNTTTDTGTMKIITVPNSIVNTTQRGASGKTMVLMGN